MDTDIQRLKAKVAELEAQLSAAKEQPEIVPTIVPDAVYNVDEVKDRLRCGKTNVYDLINSGQLAHIKVGSGRKGIRVRGKDMNTFLDHRTEGGPIPMMKHKYIKG